MDMPFVTGWFAREKRLFADAAAVRFALSERDTCMARPFATVILAGGKGTRMGSSDRHKVCFDVLGVPAIIRALETYNLCGSALNIIVVGMMAESVMATVNRRFPGTGYAFQEQPLGTGDAARQGAGILERIGFEGDVLVVAGDKVIDPRVIRRLLQVHERNRADVTLATMKRPPNSNSGLLLQSPRGNIIGILEENERQRLVALGRIGKALSTAPMLEAMVLGRILSETCGERTGRKLREELTQHPAENGPLTSADFERQFTEDERSGLVRAGGIAIPASEVLERFQQVNLSTYLFRAPVLFDSLSRLKSNRANQEVYLTDLFEILAQGKKPARVIGCEVQDPHDLMAFNNPQELLAIEEAWRARLGRGTVEQTGSELETVCPAAAWTRMFESPSRAAQVEFRSWYGNEIPWNQFRESVTAFTGRYGTYRPMAIIRSPGRINLMGRHIDHQGGFVNVMAVNREIFMAAAPREDDLIRLANTNGAQFTEQTFRISDLVSQLNWDDWQRVIDGPRLQRLLEAARGDWANYIKAAVLRLQELFRDRRLRGADIMVSGQIPMGAGLSSSSALVVAAAEAVRTFNHLPVSARRLVSLCGEGEWFVGTRGGAADHAAIKLSRRGCVTRVGFFPFRIEGSARFFPDHELIACNSGIYAGKSREARNTFNAKVTTYHIGRVWFKMLHPDLAPRIEHLRDINTRKLGLTTEGLLHLLNRLPARISRGQVQNAFTQISETERTRLERLFLSHDAPPDGYAVRDVVLFGLSEMARAERCLALLNAGEASGLGALMTISHDGDRVSRQPKPTSRNAVAKMKADSERRLGARKGKTDLALLPGAYGCSLPELDRIVDLARQLPGVEGAQLAGAGLGGCIMILVQRQASANVLTALHQHGIKGEVFRPIAGASRLRLV
jgi:N-acetylgalactosamine kinase